jgi:hypothetical protein
MNTIVKKINFSSMRNFNLSKSKIILNIHNFSTSNFNSRNFSTSNFNSRNFNFKTSKLGSVKKLGTRTFTIKKSTAGRKKSNVFDALFSIVLLGLGLVLVVKKLSFIDLNDSNILLYKILLTVKDPSAEYNDAFINASGDGHLEVVKLLLQDSRVDPSDRDHCAIINAS